MSQLLPVSPADKPQIWIIDTRDRVLYIINTVYVKRMTLDHTKLMSLVPFDTGKSMIVLHARICFEDADGMRSTVSADR